MLVGRIVVDDGVDHLSHGDLRLDRIEEADELLVAMALHVAANDGAIEDVEGCFEEATRSMPHKAASIRRATFKRANGQRLHARYAVGDPCPARTVAGH